MDMKTQVSAAGEIKSKVEQPIDQVGAHPVGSYRPVTPGTGRVACGDTTVGSGSKIVKEPSVTTAFSTNLFHRDLPEHVTVVVDGVLTDLDPDDPVPDDRPVGRVVVTMPDFVADTLAHALAKAWQVNQLFGGNIEIGPTERAVAEALLAAAEASGSRCPEGGLELPLADHE